MKYVIYVLVFIGALYIIRQIQYSQAKNSGTKAGLVNMTNEEFAKAIATGDYVLIDVRSQTEIDAGYIPGAIFKTHTSFPGSVTHLAKDKPILLYCAGGVRSAMAGKALIDAGYTNVSHLAKGYGGWNGETTK